MKVILRAFSGDQEILFEVGTVKVTVGRHSENIVPIKDRLCSGRHCVFWVEGKKLFIEDLDSKNGTFVNGIRVKRNQIFVQDKITLGSSVITVSHAHNVPEIIKALDFPGTFDDRTAVGISLQTISKIDMIRHHPRTSLEADKRVFGKRVTQKILRPRGYEDLTAPGQFEQSGRRWIAALVDIAGLIVAFGLPFALMLEFDSELGLDSSWKEILKSPDLPTASLASVFLGVLFRKMNTNMPDGSIGERVAGIGEKSDDN